MLFHAICVLDINLSDLQIVVHGRDVVSFLTVTVECKKIGFYTGGFLKCFFVIIEDSPILFRNL